MPRRSRSNGRHGAGSRSLRALNPMKQIRVRASTPPATASGTTPSATRSAASASEPAPELQAVTIVSRGPPRPSVLPTTSACEEGKHDMRAGGIGAAGAPDPGVVQRLAGRRERDAIRPRAAPRARDAGGHLGGDPASEALGVDQGDRTDGAATAADPFPEGLDAGPERADDAEPRDGDRLHARAVLEAM